MSASKKPINELDFDSSDTDTDEDLDKFDVKKKRVDKPKTVVIVPDSTPTIIGKLSYTNYLLPNSRSYLFKDWSACFPDSKVNLRSLVFNSDWYEFFDSISIKPYYNRIQEFLSGIVAKDTQTIVPDAELLFNAFNICSPQNIRVVIIGQDPYHGSHHINGKTIPQAIGLSFSAARNYPIPPSLNNIISNMIEYKHISSKPSTGNLSFWAMQGCFMINTALTTIHSQPGAHRKVWAPFTTDLIEYITSKYNNLVFLAWGADANRLCKDINPSVHHIITSSHPSPYSYQITFTGLAYGKFKSERDRKRVIYQSFHTVDHFGKANDYLISKERQPILWDIV
jgi:uracil-DNA glycosylase